MPFNLLAILKIEWRVTLSFPLITILSGVYTLAKIAQIQGFFKHRKYFL